MPVCTKADGLSVIMRSTQVSISPRGKWVGSLISCSIQLSNIKLLSDLPAGDSTCSSAQNSGERALKSPVKYMREGFSLLMLSTIFCKPEM